MPGDDVKHHAVNIKDDLYELLGIPDGATETEIKRGYRKSALKYHPDKVGPSTAALDTFHRLGIAQDVLLDESARQLYDNARRARAEKVQRDAAFEGRRKWMKEDLERREGGAVKRKFRQEEEEDALEMEIRRLAADGARRRQEREEQLRKQAAAFDALDMEEEQRLRASYSLEMAQEVHSSPSEVDRSVTLRFPKNNATAHIDKDYLSSAFSRFGPVEDVVLRDKKIKIEGEKHRQEYKTGVLVFKSVVGAHAAVSDFARAVDDDAPTFGMLEAVGWAGGKEPTFLSDSQSREESIREEKTPHLRTHSARPSNDEAKGLKKPPGYASFKSNPTAAVGLSQEESTIIRLMNAERQRMETKTKFREAEAAS